KSAILRMGKVNRSNPCSVTISAWERKSNRVPRDRFEKSRCNDSAATVVGKFDGLSVPPGNRQMACGFAYRSGAPGNYLRAVLTKRLAQLVWKHGKRTCEPQTGRGHDVLRQSTHSQA